MRISTQMFQATMRKAGLPINSMSLLDVMGKTSTQRKNLLSNLDKTSQVTSKIQKRNYQSLQNSAEDLQQSADALSSQKLYEDAKESGDTKEICDYAEKLVKYYNSTVKSLKDTSTSATLNEYYRQTFVGLASNEEEALNSIGITRGKDGNLNLDQEKLKQADVDTLEKVLGGEFTSKLSFLADRVADNAKVNAGAIASQYNVWGNSYFTEANKYNFWG